MPSAEPLSDAVARVLPPPLLGLPGDEIIVQGLRDLAAETESIQALLVAIVAPGLRRLGVAVPDMADRITDAALRLYRLVGDQRPAGAHAAFNAWIRRVDRFVRAAVAVRRSES